MTTKVQEPQMEDVVSVGSRISWGAIFAGCILALAMYFLLTVLGAAVGVSVSERMDARQLGMGAVIWAIVTICASLFVGGMVVSQFTVGENKMEAVLYGIIMWALLFAILIGLGATGASAGFNAMVNMAQIAQTAPGQTWEASARRAGVPANQIDEWRRKLESETAPTVAAEDRANLEAAATRIAWYTFAGTWISMLAAAAGTWFGAGPTFKLVAVTRV
jgi:hypothetical protein